LELFPSGGILELARNGVHDHTPIRNVFLPEHPDPMTNPVEILVAVERLRAVKIGKVWVGLLRVHMSSIYKPGN
jgi:hypothetical protein